MRTIKKLIQSRYKLFLDALISRVSGHCFAEWEQIENNLFTTHLLHTSNKHLGNTYKHWGFSHVDY